MRDALQSGLKPGKVMRFGLIAVFLTAILGVLFRPRNTDIVQNSDQTARVEKKHFVSSLRLNGTTQASHSFARQ